MLVSSRSIKAFYNAGILLVTLALSGCATTAPHSPTGNATPQLSTTHALAQFLASASAGASQTFAQSRWGENVTVFVEHSYYSARGAECRRLHVESSSVSTTTLMCSDDHLQWREIKRLATVATQ